MMTMTGEKVATNSDESVMTMTEEKSVAEIPGKTGKSGAQNLDRDFHCLTLSHKCKQYIKYWTEWVIGYADTVDSSVSA